MLAYQGEDDCRKVCLKRDSRNQPLVEGDIIGQKGIYGDLDPGRLRPLLRMIQPRK